MKAKPLEQYMEERKFSDHIFLNKVRKHIEDHPLFTHPFLEAFGKGELSLDQIKIWAKQRLFSSRRFPCFLGAFVSHVEDIDIRHAYITQMYEEHGNLDPEKVHSRQLTRLIFALGIGRQELNQEKMLSGTQNFVDTYMRISQEGDLLKCMGMYALGSEPVIAMEMVLCLQGLATLPWILDEDKIYFSDHAYHDYRHTAELTDILLPFIKSKDDEDRVWQGIVEILDARKGLYDGIARAAGL